MPSTFFCRYSNFLKVEGVTVVPFGAIDDEVISDGYWVLLPELSEGKYSIDLGGFLAFDCADPLFSVDVTYNLTVGDDDDSDSDSDSD